ETYTIALRNAPMYGIRPAASGTSARMADDDHSTGPAVSTRTARVPSANLPTVLPHAPIISHSYVNTMATMDTFNATAWFLTSSTLRTPSANDTITIGTNTTN